MKKIILILCCSLIMLLSSCERYPSSVCHKNLYIWNNSDLPINIYQLFGYNSFDTTYAFEWHNVELETTFPNDTASVIIAGHPRDCIEDLMEWYQTHPDSPPSPRLKTIYICDTNVPDVRFYSTPDSVLMHYNILKEINLIDSSVSSLRKCNFTLQYP